MRESACCAPPSLNSHSILQDSTQATTALHHKHSHPILLTTCSHPTAAIPHNLRKCRAILNNLAFSSSSSHRMANIRHHKVNSKAIIHLKDHRRVSMADLRW